MNKPSFDSLIKNKLKEQPIHSDIEGAWDLFVKNTGNRDYDEPENDEAFDALINKKLQESKVETPSKAWSLFSTYKYNNFDKKANIIRVKIMESAAIFLLLLTFVQWFAVEKPYSPHIRHISSEILAHGADHARQKLENKGLGEPILNNYFSPNPSKSSIQSQVSNNPINERLSLESEAKNVEAKTFDIQKIKSLNNNYLSSLNDQKKNISKNPLYKTVNPEADNLFSLNIWDTPSLSLNSNDETIHKPLQALPPLDSYDTYSEFPLILPMTINADIPHPRWALSAYMASDANLINTPFDKIYSLASYQREFLNSSFGIGLSKTIKALEYQIDLSYSKRSYEPQKFTESFGAKDYYYLEISLDRIAFDILSPAFMIKYHFINNKKWSAYLTGISALNLVMNAEYDITESKILGRPPSERYLPATPRLDKKPFNDGILKDKAFAQNYFITAGLGFGIEKSISDDTSIFVETSHQRHLLSADIGVGPNKDKIHTSTLKLGVKTGLN